MAIKELKSVVLGSEEVNKGSIIGTFEGECADGLTTNANNMDIPVEVWTTLFNSDDYKKAIELGWYIGFLGHPDDPDCMDYKNACIVMTEGHIDDDGKVYGKFNLIDTPVGRIVKSFIDAGVTFGISVRGVGETVSNGMSEVVSAESFVFRGFDIVTFPAFENAIPEFQALAASSSAESKVKYKKICASIDTNLPEITSPVAIEVIQEQFSPNSDEYTLLENRKSELIADDPEIAENLEETQVEVLKQKFDGLYELYQEAQDDLAELGEQINESDALICELSDDCDYADKQMFIFERTITNQSKKLKGIEAKYQAKNKALVMANRKIKNENQKLITSNTKLQEQNSKLREITASQKTELKKAEKSNLIYSREINSAKQDIQAAQKAISEKDETIAGLQSQLNETVKKQKIEASKSLDRDDEISNLRKELMQARKILAGYQTAYVGLYENASGVDLSSIQITAKTSIDELHSVIRQQSTTLGMASPELEPSVLYDDDLDGTGGMAIL